MLLTEPVGGVVTNCRFYDRASFIVGEPNMTLNCMQICSECLLSVDVTLSRPPLRPPILFSRLRETFGTCRTYRQLRPVTVAGGVHARPFCRGSLPQARSIAHTGPSAVAMETIQTALIYDYQLNDC